MKPSNAALPSSLSDRIAASSPLVDLEFDLDLQVVWTPEYHAPTASHAPQFMARAGFPGTASCATCASCYTQCGSCATCATCATQCGTCATCVTCATQCGTCATCFHC